MQCRYQNNIKVSDCLVKLFYFTVKRIIQVLSKCIIFAIDFWTQCECLTFRGEICRERSRGEKYVINALEKYLVGRTRRGMDNNRFLSIPFAAAVAVAAPTGYTFCVL